MVVILSLSILSITIKLRRMDLLLLYMLRFAFWLLNCLPYKLRVRVLTVVVRVVFTFIPKYKKIALINLKIAFPELTEAERTKIFEASCESIARLIADFARMPDLNSDWVKRNVDCEFLEKLSKIKRDNPGKGIIYATGHLGSFELLAHAAPMFGYPLSFVVRNSELPNLDQWWRSKREINGNKVIDRRGAVNEIFQQLKSGTDVGILFDQNVRQGHAVFVKWFGKAAATTKTVALAAIRTESPVVVASVHYLGDEKYKIEAKDFDFTNIYKNEDLVLEDKVREITQVLSSEYERMIKLSPHEWFWVHRRWKTRPNGEAENLYA